MTIRNKYSGKCRTCDETIPAGTLVDWAPGEGITHIDYSHCLVAMEADNQPAS